MAIHPKLEGFVQNQTASATPTQPIDIKGWTEQATEALSAMSVSTAFRSPRRSSLTLGIPLDEEPTAKCTDAEGDFQRPDIAASTYPPHREPIRRDSLKRREALLKGKEGSRRRQRWENDRLLNNPWAQPPLPSDWEVHPTYPRHAVPYYLAPLWDAKMAAQNEEAQEKRVAKLNDTKEVQGLSHIPKEMRAKLKKAKAAKGLLQDLEEEVRKFVKKWEEKEKMRKREGLHDIDSEDEEIVFVGRNGQMHDMPPSPRSKKSAEDDVKRDKLLFDSLEADRGASFGRWLVHSIANYYGLRTWSVTVGDPARREAYIGIKPTSAGGASMSHAVEGLPRPLWGMV